MHPIRRFVRHLLATTALVTATAGAADPALTIYRSDGDALFEGGSSPVADGHAVVHEQRTLQLTGARQTVVVDGLPAMLDTEAVAIDLGNAGRVLAQRIVSAGDGGALAAHRGERVQVFGANDGRMIADGILVAFDGGNLGLRDVNGRISYVRDFTRVDFPDGNGLPGSTLQLVVDGKQGPATSTLTYPTSGLGWRAAYAATLQAGDCSLRFDALASIANRSGRDFSAARIKLIAGAPNFAKAAGAPRPMMMKAMAAAAAPDDIPQQSSLGDYRSYAVDGGLDLPDASVTQVPLYASRDLGCERRWLFENGNAWFPQKPMLQPDGDQRGGGPVQSQLKFVAAENLPAGNLRVLVHDKDGRAELLGENRIGDVQKGRNVDVGLGVAFDLAATRERTAFSIDKAAHEMDEGLRITLTNTGESARSVTVREHPGRWRTWSVVSSSQKPEKQTPDLLEFRVAVPANGKATLDYLVRYAWAAGDE
jgi:hypothetical protein